MAAQAMHETKPDLDAMENGVFQHLEIEGLDIRVFTRTCDGVKPAAKRPPLLICNGLGQGIEILFPLIEQLPDRNIVTFDAPGIGRSETPADHLAIEDYTRITARIMERLGHESYDVLGISWGGSLAQQLAHDYPERCRKLVLAITSAGGMGSWWGSPVALSEIMFPMRFTNKSYGNFIGPWMYGGAVILQPDMFKKYSEHAIAPTSEGYFGQVKAMCNWTSLAWLHKLEQPTQIIAGSFDALIPITNQMLLASRLPNARLKVYPDGHLLMYSHRKEVGNLMTCFLDEDMPANS